MNKEEILAMTPSKELDWKVAEFMGVNISLFEFGWEAGNHNYSSDISAAWEVFTKFDIPVLKKGFDQEDNDYYCCQIGDHYVTDNTAELAITKCALLAVMK